MNPIVLSKRLQTVADYLPEYINNFADIGSDHALLPCYVCMNNPQIKAIAGEVNEGPYFSAVQQVKKHQLENQIEVRLGDGLEIIEKREVECIIIAGMGGTLIKNILLEGISKLSGVKRLVLQPNIDAQSIREFAVKFNYEIIDEQLIEDDGYIYELVVLEPAEHKVEYSLKELYMGPILLQHKNQIFYKKWQQLLNKKKNIVNQMNRAKEVDEQKINKFIQQVKWIKEELGDVNR